VSIAFAVRALMSKPYYVYPTYPTPPASGTKAHNVATPTQAKRELKSGTYGDSHAGKYEDVLASALN